MERTVMIDIPSYVTFDPLVSVLMIYVVVHVRWVKNSLKIHGKRIKRLEKIHMEK